MASMPECSPPVARVAPVRTEAVASLRFSAVYDEHFDFVWRMMRRLGIPTANLDDAVQDVFVTLHRRLGEYDGRASVRSWLFGFVSHVARDHRRRYRRKVAPCVPTPSDSGADLAMASANPSPVALAERSERVALLNRILDSLDDGKREILVLSFLEQMTVPEIADLLGLNLNTAYSRLRAAKQSFDLAYSSEQARDRSDRKAGA
jgi:RNA polymerase sigma-70 factor (ECF subfamily)